MKRSTLPADLGGNQEEATSRGGLNGGLRGHGDVGKGK